jgi:hypothetical protein
VQGAPDFAVVKRRRTFAPWTMLKYSAALIVFQLPEAWEFFMPRRRDAGWCNAGSYH